MKNKKPKKVFVEGPIPPDKIAQSLTSHASKMDIDEHGMFMRQVKKEKEDQGVVEAIEFITDIASAEKILYEIREDAFSKFSLTCMHIYHSLGKVAPGQLYLFIFTSSSDQKEALKACEYLADRIAAEVKVERKKHRA